MNIEHYLLRWSAWNRINTGAPKRPVCLIGKLIKTPVDDEIDPLSDDEAEQVNAALSLLKIRQPDAHNAIMVRYSKGVFDDCKAAKFCGVSKSKLYINRVKAHSFLEGALNRVNR